MNPVDYIKRCNSQLIGIDIDIEYDIEEYNKIIGNTTYDFVISIGDSCNTADIIMHMGYRYRSFPFDYIKITPNIVYDLFVNDFEDYSQKEIPTSFRNTNWMNYYTIWPLEFSKFLISKYGLLFTHYPRGTNINSKDGAIKLFNKRIRRLKNILNDESLNILLVYIPMHSLYFKENRLKQTEFYNYIIKTYDFLKNNYKSNIKILSFSMNQNYKSYDNAVYNINYKLDSKYYDPPKDEYHLGQKDIIKCIFNFLVGKLNVNKNKIEDVHY